MNCGDEVEAEAEAFTATTVTLRKDTKNLEATDDLLNPQPEAGQGAVGLFVLVGKRVMLGSFDRQAGVRVQLVESQVAEVGKHDGVGMNVDSAFFE